MNEESEQQDQTEPAESAAPTIILECPATFSLGDADGRETAGGDCQARLDRETLSILPRFGEALHFSLRDILEISGGDYEIHLSLASSEEVLLRDLGYRYEDFVKALCKQRNEVVLKDMLMDEKVRNSGVEAEFVHLDDAGQPMQKGNCEPRLYETALVILPETGDPIRFPYSQISEVSAKDYAVAIVTDFGERITFSQMGSQFEPFARSLSDSINALFLKAQALLKELLPEADPAVIRKAARLMKEGKAASRTGIEALSPQLWTELEKKLEASGIRESYDFLRSLSQQQEIYIGIKRGLLGDLTGEYLWFLIPIYHAAPEKPGNAIAMEAASEDGGKATYFFRIVGRDEYPHLGGREDFQQRTSLLISQINQCMLTVNFRREPIYLPEEKLDLPQYARYRFAIQRLPALCTLRHLFIGRVIHSNPEQWKKDVTDLLQFNTSTRHDADKWTRAEEGRHPT